MRHTFGSCGIYCELCPLFRDEKCEGCLKRNQWYKPACSLFLCATDRGKKCCFECTEFPCKTHYGKGMVYAKESLNNWKELIAKPREYFIKIKEQFKKEA
jgi:hypothetical protein